MTCRVEGCRGAVTEVRLGVSLCALHVSAWEASGERKRAGLLELDVGTDRRQAGAISDFLRRMAAERINRGHDSCGRNGAEKGAVQTPVETPKVEG